MHLEGIRRFFLSKLTDLFKVLSSDFYEKMFGVTPNDLCTLGTRLCDQGGAVQQPVEGDGGLLYRQDEALRGSQDRAANHRSAVFSHLSCFFGPWKKTNKRVSSYFLLFLAPAGVSNSAGPIS